MPPKEEFFEDLVEALTDRREIDWSEIQDQDELSDPRISGLELLDEIGRAFQQAERESNTPSPPSSWGTLQILEKLGEGSFGEVYRAHDPLLDRSVALKLCRGTSKASGIQAFLKEARRLARIRHPNIVTIHGVEIHDGKVGLWTELIKGETLDEILDQTGPLGPREALSLGIDLCRALAAVHSSGLLHGDVKMANVMREEGGRIVLMDFGAGRELNDRHEEGPAFGTPVVTAPEILEGQSPSQASDLYSLGVLLFRALTGHYPVQARTYEELIQAHEGDRRGALRNRRSDLALETVEAIELALRVLPNERYASAGAMEQQLANALRAEIKITTPAARQQPSSPPIDPAPSRSSTPSTVGPDFQAFIGRDREIEFLNQALRDTKNGVPRPVFIHGSTGVGKTELTRRFFALAKEQGARTLYSRSFDYEGSTTSSYESLLNILRKALDVDSVSALTRTALDRFGVEFPAEMVEPQRSSVTKAIPAQAAASPEDHFRGAVPITACLRALAGEQLLVLAFDDLQWSDPATRDVVGYLMRSLESESLLLLLIARQGDHLGETSPYERWLGRQASYRSFTTLELGPFGDSDIARILNATFPGLNSYRDIPPSDLSELSRLTQGNPYFLSEICRLLVASQRILSEPAAPSGWSWKGLKGLTLPQSLVLAANEKLGRIGQSARSILDPASVIGYEFQIQTLVDVLNSDKTHRSNDEASDHVESLLEEASLAGLIAPTQINDMDYCFGHPLLREVVYSAIAPGRRRKLHRRIAETLEASSRGTRRYAVALSVHWSIADNPEATFDWSLRAWLSARQRWLWPEAVDCLERADRAARQLESYQPLSLRQKYQLALGLSESYASVGRIKDSLVRVETCVSLAQELDDSAAEGAAWLQSARTVSALGRYAEAAEKAEIARQLFSTTDDSNGLALAMLQLAITFAATGDYEKVRSTTQQIDALVVPTSEISALASGIHGWSLALQGFYPEALARLDKARSYHQRTGNIRQLALILNRIQWVYRSTGQYEKAVLTAQQARMEFRRVEDANFEAKANMAIGQSRLAQGLFQEGFDHLHQTLATLGTIGDSHCEAEVLWLLGRAQSELGQQEHAAQSLHKAREMIEVIGDKDDEFRFLIDSARIDRRAGRLENALNFAALAEEIAQEINNPEGVACARVETVRLLLLAGDSEACLPMAQKAASTLERLGSGEYWRALHTLGLAYAAQPGWRMNSEVKALGLQALRQAVTILATVRNQIDSNDLERRSMSAQGHSAPARDLHRLLMEDQQTTEAKILAESWPILQNPSHSIT